ncbi:unnamed protein product [Pedinophyceae sp. YPF-701]|nr:unnamed protein product [Pedinophyceae sp. YPF-701]
MRMAGHATHAGDLGAVIRGVCAHPATGLASRAELTAALDELEAGRCSVEDAKNALITSLATRPQANGVPVTPVKHVVPRSRGLRDADGHAARRLDMASAAGGPHAEAHARVRDFFAARSGR